MKCKERIDERRDARRMSRARRHGGPRSPFLWNGDVWAAGIGEAAERFSPVRFPLFTARTGNCDIRITENAVIVSSLFGFVFLSVVEWRYGLWVDFRQIHTVCVYDDEDTPRRK